MIRRLTDGLAWALRKGVASCDKLRVGACSLRSGGARIGLPAAGDTCGTPVWEREPLERKHPSRERKRNQLRFPDVAASGKGRVQTEPVWETMQGCGVVGPDRVLACEVEVAWKGRPKRVIVP